jgi:Spy/CpxP family protein refolding chaperone
MKAFAAMWSGLAMAGVLLAGTALAQAPGGEMGPGFGAHRPPMEKAFGPQGEHVRWWNNPKVVERLKLTEAQRKTFDGILLDHREKLIDLRGNVEKAELEMEPLMSADQANEAKILAQIDKVAQARAELEKANARFLLAIRAKLTPEQWKQLQADRTNHEHGGSGRDVQRPNRQGQGAQFHHQMPPPPPAAQGAEPAVPEAGPQAPAPQVSAGSGTAEER